MCGTHGFIAPSLEFPTTSLLVPTDVNGIVAARSRGTNVGHGVNSIDDFWGTGRSLLDGALSTNSVGLMDRLSSSALDPKIKSVWFEWQVASVWKRQRGEDGNGPLLRGWDFCRSAVSYQEEWFVAIVGRLRCVWSIRLFAYRRTHFRYSTAYFKHNWVFNAFLETLASILIVQTNVYV